MNDFSYKICIKITPACLELKSPPPSPATSEVSTAGLAAINQASDMRLKQLPHLSNTHRVKLLQHELVTPSLSKLQALSDKIKFLDPKDEGIPLEISGKKYVVKWNRADQSVMIQDQKNKFGFNIKSDGRINFYSDDNVCPNGLPQIHIETLLLCSEKIMGFPDSSN